MRQASLAILFFLATRVATATPLATLDQSADSPGHGYGWAAILAQDFTVGRTGILTHVEIPLTAGDRSSSFGELQLLAMRDGKPGQLPADILASASVVVSATPWTFAWATLENINLPVSVGDKFAIALKQTAAANEELYWSLSTEFQYPGGNPWRPTGLDGHLVKWDGISVLNFRTFVRSIPEPATITLASPILVTLSRVRRRQSRRPASSDI